MHPERAVRRVIKYIHTYIHTCQCAGDRLFSSLFSFSLPFSPSVSLSIRLYISAVARTSLPSSLPSVLSVLRTSSCACYFRGTLAPVQLARPTEADNIFLHNSHSFFCGPPPRYLSLATSSDATTKEASVRRGETTKLREAPRITTHEPQKLDSRRNLRGLSLRFALAVGGGKQF